MILLSEVIEENGKTIRENNLEKKHELELGHLVIFNFEEYVGNNTYIRTRGDLYIVGHTRDCDGSPLYILSDIPVEYPQHALPFSYERLLYKEISNVILFNYSYHLNDTDGILGIISGPHNLYTSLAAYLTKSYESKT